MSNVHGFGDINNQPRRDLPPIRRNTNPNPQIDNNEGGFFDNFSEPVLADQLKVA